MKEALAIIKKLRGEDHPNVAILSHNIARLLQAQVPTGVLASQNCCRCLWKITYLYIGKIRRSRTVVPSST